MDVLTQGWLREMDDFVDPNEVRRGISSPDREGEKKSGVIRVDLVIQAIHLAVSKVILEQIPNHILNDIVRPASKVSGKAAAKLAARRVAQSLPVVGELAGLATEFASTLVQNAIATKIEGEVRAVFTEVRRDLNAEVLGKSKRVRKVRDVATRHFTEPKKRMNKWRSR